MGSIPVGATRMLIILLMISIFFAGNATGKIQADLGKVF